MGQGSGGATSPGGAAAFEVPQAVKDRVRADEARSDTVTDPVENQEVAKQEKEVLHTLAMSLGKEGPAPGMPPYEAASQSLAELRAANFKLRIEPVTNANGAAIGGGDFIQLKDSFSERVQALQGKLASGTATAAERAEIVGGAKQIMKLTGLKMQVGAVSRATMMTNVHVQNGGLTMMLKIAGMVTARKQQNMDWTADDYARVKRILARQKHWEAMAAGTMGMLAAYEAVVGSTTADPKALDAIADATTKAFPLDPQVSDDDAKSYVSHLSDDAASQKAKYEAMMRQAMGDAVYEAQYKAGIDSLFGRAAAAAQTKSVTQNRVRDGRQLQGRPREVRARRAARPGVARRPGQVQGGSRAGAGGWRGRQRRGGRYAAGRGPGHGQQGREGDGGRAGPGQRRRRRRPSERGRHVSGRWTDPGVPAGRGGAHQGRLQGRPQVRSRAREPHSGRGPRQGGAPFRRQAARPVQLKVLRPRQRRSTGAIARGSSVMIASAPTSRRRVASAGSLTVQ